ncbi:MAG: ParB N-terminal domain-containing protein, partial [Nanoarchaeota archaeon]|nr:ParB N-terminal domain-containing protein [Nanoarchaeota archaeon]
KPYEFNPRNITEKGLKDLKQSIENFGLAEPIVINTTNIIIGGHARYFVLKERGDKECDCYMPSRKLNDKEVKELNIRLNKNIAGIFDFDILANNFELPDLLECGFTENELGLLNKQSDGINTEIKEEDIKAYNKAHVLISYDPDKLSLVKNSIDVLFNIEGIEIEQSSN